MGQIKTVKIFYRLKKNKDFKSDCKKYIKVNPKKLALSNKVILNPNFDSKKINKVTSDSLMNVFKLYNNLSQYSVKVNEYIVGDSKYKYSSLKKLKKSKGLICFSEIINGYCFFYGTFNRSRISNITFDIENASCNYNWTFCGIIKIDANGEIQLIDIYIPSKG